MYIMKNDTRNRSISSTLLVNEAKKLWYTVEIVQEEKNLFYIHTKREKILCKNIDCWLNTAVWFKITEDKELTYRILERIHIPVPQTHYIQKSDRNWKREKKMTFPCVTKPIDGSHGDGVTVHIQDIKWIEKWIEKVWETSDGAIIQNYIKGDDHRILVVGDIIAGASKRIPPQIQGDGKASIQHLIEKENETNPERNWWDHASPLSHIKIDHELDMCLQEQWYTRKSILEKWKEIFVRKNANLSTGWIPIDITDILHPSIKEICIEAAHAVWLEVAWVDIITTDITKPLEETDGAIIEINATPWLRMHYFPSIWKPRNVGKDILLLALKKTWKK